MNNRFIFLLAWSMLWCPIYVSGQILTAEHHTPLFNDSLEVYKMQSVDVGDSGQHCVWDFSGLPIDSAEIIAADYYACADTQHIGLHRERANYYLLCTTDTLWQQEYETSLTRMKYSSPLPMLRFPFAYGDSVVDSIMGNGQYCHSIPLTIEGKSIVHADACGRLVLPDLTVDSALRVHSILEYNELSYTKTIVHEERYQWYSACCRYSLLENLSVRTIAGVDTTYFSAAYYIPQEQEDLLKQEHEQQDLSIENVDNPITNAAYLPNPVIADLCINYSLTRNAQAYISLHYNGGVCTYQTPMHYEDEGNHSILVNMTGMPTGNYVVYIHADDAIVSGTIMKL